MSPLFSVNQYCYSDKNLKCFRIIMECVFDVGYYIAFGYKCTGSMVIVMPVRGDSTNGNDAASLREREERGGREKKMTSLLPVA